VASAKIYPTVGSYLAKHLFDSQAQKAAQLWGNKYYQLIKNINLYQQIKSPLAKC
jgi:hypothetical protein